MKSKNENVPARAGNLRDVIVSFTFQYRVKNLRYSLSTRIWYTDAASLSSVDLGIFAKFVPLLGMNFANETQNEAKLEASRLRMEVSWRTYRRIIAGLSPPFFLLISLANERIVRTHVLLAISPLGVSKYGY